MEICKSEVGIMIEFVLLEFVEMESKYFEYINVCEFELRLDLEKEEVMILLVDFVEILFEIVLDIFLEDFIYIKD